MKTMKYRGRKASLWMVFLVILAVLAIISHNSLENAKNELLEKAKTYTIYLDGNKVDNDKIDIFLYNGHVDDEKQVIYITHKCNK